MTATTPASAAKGSRIRTITWNSVAAIAQATTFEAIGQSDDGMPMRVAGKFIGMYVSGEYAGGTLGQTVTYTAYKGSVAAGNKVFELVHTQAGAAAAISTDTTTPAVSEAVCTFTATDDLILVIVTSATSGNIIENFVALDFQADI